MPNMSLIKIIKTVDDSDLTAAKKLNSICLAFAAWAREVRDGKASGKDDINETNIIALKKAVELLNSPLGSANIANMFSNPSIADNMLAQFTTMINQYSPTAGSVDNVMSQSANKPLPKPAARSASVESSVPAAVPVRLFSHTERSLTLSDTSRSQHNKPLPATPKRK